MELKKLIVVAIFAVALCYSTVACGEQDKSEEHEYAYYQASAPTCTEKGKIERRCVDCGETDYLEVEAPGHNYVGGICTRCGAKEKREYVNDYSQFYTAESVYELAVQYKYVLTPEQYYANLEKLNAHNIYVGVLGRIKMTVNDMSVDLGNVRKDFDIETDASLAAVVTVMVRSRTLFITDSTGTQRTVGRLAAFADDGTRRVKGLLINKKNVLVALFTDGSVEALGRISENSSDATASELVFGNYNGKLIGPFDRNITSVTVPYSHLGTRITSIGSAAFRECVGLTSVAIESDNIVIEGYAFYGCTALRSIVLPENTSAYSSAFDGCTALRTIYYKGSAAQWSDCIFAVGNDAITHATVYYYSEARPSYSGNYWHYVSGVPAVW